ncbi:MAG TPA: ferritin family protein [Kofleriaceae bacterium]|nr:ferritin family protein [Kofleriaceae bacterium]
MTPAARHAVAAMWRYRERVEYEAAALFAALADELDTARLGSLAARARTAADDERRHALRCRAIVAACQPELGPLPPRAISVAPPQPEPDPARRALYASVAMGCVTETLSCALLVAMRDEAEFGPTRAAVDEIVKDEIEHSRIGWAHLATAAARGDVTWLASHIAAMRSAALTHEIEEVPVSEDLSRYGILPRARVTVIVEATWRDVIVPGFAHHGIRTDP